jgi:hypothetical protein
MKRILVLCAALLLPMASYAQGTQLQIGTDPSLEVRRLAPQLVAFAGGEVNFANLVNGLALGLPITLTSTVSPGVTQVVNFTPSGTMTTTQIAQTLESARQALISRGIATPSAQQIAAVVAGGTLPTALGNTPVSGLVNSTSGVTVNQASPAAAMQGTTAGGAAAATAAAGANGARNTSDSRFPRGISDTPPLPVPGVTTGPASAAGATSAAPTAPAPSATPAPMTATPAAPAAPAAGSAPFGAR